MKLLISWLAFNNDFLEGKVKVDGPTMTFHKFHFHHDKHLILSSAKEDDIRMIHIVNELSRLYPERKNLIESVYMNISDVINLEEIKSKIEKLLIMHRSDDIEIFISPGTPTMQLSWVICHITLGLNTRLFQTRPAQFSKDKKTVELLEMKIDKSLVPVTAIIKEELLAEIKKVNKDILITESLKPIYDKAYKIAQTDNVTTIIVGESGTGKENLARYIHDNSHRRENAFVTVNCSAMGENLLESRLFGYVKGSFTGADKNTPGLFEDAEGGTIFLDEIGDISSYMQQSLLRVIQNKEIQPIGGKSKKIDVRIVSATNKDLKKLCVEEKFRWDLYYRLSTTELELPSLKERGIEEKKQLINHFIKLKQKQFRRTNKISIPSDTLEILLAYPFPGNIRELENLIESFYVFHESEVNGTDLPKRIKDIEPSFSFRWIDAEKSHIEKVLQHFKGNKRQACKALGYGSINTLIKKIKEYDLVID